MSSFSWTIRWVAQQLYSNCLMDLLLFFFVSCRLKHVLDLSEMLVLSWTLFSLQNIMIRFQEKCSLIDTTLININEFYIIILIIIKKNRENKELFLNTQALLSVAVYNIYRKKKTRIFISYKSWLILKEKEESKLLQTLGNIIMIL